MANTKTNKPDLKRTKQVNSGRGTSSAPKIPYDRNYDRPQNYGGMDYRDAIAMTNSAAQHPSEMLGFTLGSYIGNYLDRGYNKRMDAAGDEAYDSVLRSFASQPSQQDMINQTYGFTDPRQDAQNYINDINADTVAQAEQNAVTNGMQNAAEAGVNTQMQAQQAVNNGMPVTGAGASAMGLNPKDMAQSYLLAYKMDQFARNGENPSQARRDMQKLDQMADNMGNSNLLGVTRDQFGKALMQDLEGRKLSYNARKAQYDRLMANFDAQRESQANQYATQLFLPSLTTNPDDYEKKYLGVLTQALQQTPEYAKYYAPALQVIEKNRAKRQALEDARTQAFNQAQIMSDVQKAFPDLGYSKSGKLTGSTVATSSGSGGSGSKKTKEVDPEEERYKTALAIKKNLGEISETDPDFVKKRDTLDRVNMIINGYQDGKAKQMEADVILNKQMSNYDNFTEAIRVLRDYYGWSPDEIRGSRLYQEAHPDYQHAVDDYIDRRG